MVCEIGIGQLPRVSGKDPERKEWTQLLKRVGIVYFVWPLLENIFEYISFKHTLILCGSSGERANKQM